MTPRLEHRPSPCFYTGRKKGFKNRKFILLSAAVLQELTLDQKTPLRVLHRRALAVRQRVVHSMNTRFLDAHHFHLELKTQAGTYP